MAYGPNTIELTSSFFGMREGAVNSERSPCSPLWYRGDRSLLSTPHSYQKSVVERFPSLALALEALARRYELWATVAPTHPPRKTIEILPPRHTPATRDRMASTVIWLPTTNPPRLPPPQGPRVGVFQCVVGSVPFVPPRLPRPVAPRQNPPGPGAHVFLPSEPISS